MKKFKKSTLQNLFSVKGGALIGSRTNTQPGTTVEFKNDKDSNAAIEAQSSSSVYSPVEP